MPRVLNTPEPGFYKGRFFGRDRPLVAAVIYQNCPMVMPDLDIHPEDWCRPLDRSRRLYALVDGKPFDPVAVWHSRSEAIDEAEYRYMTDAAAWDRVYDPDAPTANPHQPIDHLAVRPPF